MKNNSQDLKWLSRKLDLRKIKGQSVWDNLTQEK